MFVSYLIFLFFSSTFSIYLYKFQNLGEYIVRKITKGLIFMEKHIRVTGNSTVSWKDAILQTIAEASKTIDYLTEVKILDQRAKINEKKIQEYLVDLELSFTIDRNRN